MTSLGILTCKSGILFRDLFQPPCYDLVAKLKPNNFSQICTSLNQSNKQNAGAEEELTSRREGTFLLFPCSDA